MTPPLLRSLLAVPFVDEDDPCKYRMALSHLGNNQTLYAELHPDTGYTIWLLPGHLSEQQAVECTTDVIVAYDVEEFEAQAVFDHYVQTYGLAP